MHRPSPAGVAPSRSAGRTASRMLALILIALAPRGGSLGQELPEVEGRLIVLVQATDVLTVYEVPSHKLLAAIPVGPGVREVAASPDGHKAYVARSGRQGVTVVNLDSYKVIKTIGSAGLEEPQGLQLTPDGHWLLIASGGNRRLALVDARKDVLARSLSTAPRSPHRIAMADGGHQAFVANDGSDTVSVVRIPELRLQRQITIGPSPGGVAVAPNGRLVVVGLRGSGQVALVDAGSAQIVARLPVGENPVRIGFAPRSFTALVANRNSDDVTVLDLLSRKVTKTIRVGRRPVDVVTNASGTRGYVANSESGTVTLFSIPGYQVKEEIQVGGRPSGLAFVPAATPGRGRRAAAGTPGAREGRR